VRTPHYADDLVTVYHGDCLDVLAELPDNSVDAVVTDPPYGLSNTDADHVIDTLTRWINGERDYIPSGAGFMGKAWDAFVPPAAVWDECSRVLKPGGHLLVFAGSRTVDLMGLAIRLAGFEVRDQLQYLYGSGFPKSLDVSKAIDKAAGAEREVVGTQVAAIAPGSGNYINEPRVEVPRTGAPATPDAERWQGFGTALKPAHEPIVLARKPLIGTVAGNVLAHGTGALNIDGCRIGTTVETWPATRSYAPGQMQPGHVGETQGTGEAPPGRWPANVVLDPDAAALLDEQSGVRPGGNYPEARGESKATAFASGRQPGDSEARSMGDTGGASRFFYTSKAGSDERPRVDGIAHPTVKPLDLMRWLVRLVTPPGGVVLEPFAGSGTTLEACVIEGFRAIGIEREDDYLRLIEARLTKPIQPDMFGGVA
jgi:site-specific DNA-methyltransferase (adenine-specific)